MYENLNLVSKLANDSSDKCQQIQGEMGICKPDLDFQGVYHYQSSRAQRAELYGYNYATVGGGKKSGE